MVVKKGGKVQLVNRNHNYSQIIPLYRNDMEDFSYLRSRLEIKSFSDLQENMEEQEVKGRSSATKETLVPQSGLKKVAIDIVKANIFAVVIMVVAAIVFLVPFFWIWAGKKPIGELLGGFGDWSITFILVIVGIVVHELIHGLTWACYAKSGWKSISFGIMWKLLTPYCHCDEPMHIPGYMMGAMMPCVILGVIPAIAAIFIGSLPMLAWGIFFIAAAAGDIWMTWLLTKENPWSMVLDHPSEAGFYIID